MRDTGQGNAKIIKTLKKDFFFSAVEGLTVEQAGKCFQPL